MRVNQGDQKIFSQVSELGCRIKPAIGNSALRATLASAGAGESASCFQALIDFVNSIFESIKKIFCCAKTETLSMDEEESTEDIQEKNDLNEETLKQIPNDLETQEIIEEKEIEHFTLLDDLSENTLKQISKDLKNLGIDADHQLQYVGEKWRITNENNFRWWTTFKAEEVAPYFKRLKADPDKFVALALAVASQDQATIYSGAQFLEKLDWPSEDLKKEILPSLILVMINNFDSIDWQSNGISFSGDGKNCITVRRLLFNCKEMFGLGNFLNNPLEISPYFAKGVGLAIRANAAFAIQMQEEDINEEKDESKLRTGVEVVFQQATECRFPVSMITPFLFYLKDMSELISLELKDITPMQGENLNEEDFNTLLAIMKTSPYLCRYVVGERLMNEDQAERFAEAWVEHKKGLPKEISSKSLLNSLMSWK